MNTKQKLNYGFTLVELIVVITILAILGTIAFISLQGYSKQARDSRRVSDIQNMKKSLELFSLNTGKYPLPDNSQEVIYDSELIWNQGTFGDNVLRNLSKNINKKPVDPLTESEYIYSVTNSRKEYELLSVYESELLSFNSILNNVNAENSNYVKISGNYNGIYVKTLNYYIPLPSIITSEELIGTLTLNGINIKSQIITGGSNIPGIGGLKRKTNGLPNMKLSVYTGSINNNSGVDEKEKLGRKIQLAYSGTLLSNKGIYKDIIKSESLVDIVALVDNIVLKKSGYLNRNLLNTFANGTTYISDICNTGSLDLGEINISRDNLVFGEEITNLCEYNNNYFSLGNKIVMLTCPNGWINLGEVENTGRDDVVYNGTKFKLCKYNGVGFSKGSKFIMKSCPNGWNNLGEVTVGHMNLTCDGVNCIICEY